MKVKVSNCMNMKVSDCKFVCRLSQKKLLDDNHLQFHFAEQQLASVGTFLTTCQYQVAKS